MADIHPRDLGFGSSTEGARFTSLDRWVTERTIPLNTLVNVIALPPQG